MLRAQGKRVLFADADGATEFSDIQKVLTAMNSIEKDGLGVIVGSRAHLVDTEAVVKVKFS